ncbi:uncharacterized protein LOC108937867 [Scleropages formosus]|uniref:uncharacterized protein LOC108937867 n=1 Tax=Scleropages formosus TaxID=113540 RepID=UPI0008785F1E|nr:uncharacterized protein LOC108937867 [Scleropages formosus]
MDHKLFFGITLMVGSWMLDGTASQVSAQSFTTNITNTACGNTKQCLSSPMSCNPMGNTSCLFASVSLQGNNMTVELQGYSPGYIALGLNAANATQNATVFACANINSNVSLFTTMFTNSSLVQMSTVNVSSIQGSAKGTLLQCIFSVTNFSSLLMISGGVTSVYGFLATGNVTNRTLQAPVIQLQPSLLVLSNTTSATITTPTMSSPPTVIVAQPLITNITNTACGNTKQCLSSPMSCNPMGNTSCLFASVSLQGNNMTVELQGYSPGYIALGLNAANATQNATVFACANINSNVSLFTTMFTNSSLVQMSTVNVSSIQGSAKGTLLQCIFSVTNFSSLLMISGGVTSVYGFLATGNVTNGTLQAPVIQLQPSLLILSNISTTTASPTTSSSPPISIVTQSLTKNITNADCGKTKRCLSFPESCNPAGSTPCLFTSTNFTAQGNVAFELRGESPSPGYIAVGLSNRSSLQNGLMFACAQQNSTISIYNILVKNNELFQNNMVSLSSGQGSFSRNITQCTFTANFSSAVLTRASTLSFYVLLANGTIINGTLQAPNVQLSSNLVDLSTSGSTSPIYSILALLIPLSVVTFQLF